MEDVIKSKVYARVDQLMTSDGMTSLLVTLDDMTKFNLKSESKLEDILVGCIYEFDVARYANSEKNNGFISAYMHVTEIEDTEKLNEIYRRFMNASVLDYSDLKAKIMSYIEKIENKVLHDIALEIINTYGHDFFLYPAASKLHHAYVGGLAYHTLGMLDMVDAMCQSFPYLDKDLMYAGCLLHDIGKVIEFSGVEKTEYGVEGQLLGHLLIGCVIIDNIASKMGYKNNEEVLMLMHMIASHHGVSQFGAIKRPATAEAAMLWYIDTIDSKFRVLGEELAKTKPGEFTEPVGVMDRVKFYKHK